MKRYGLVAAIALVLLLAGGAVLAQQQGPGQVYGPGGQGWVCPWSGLAPGPGYGRGPGMMHGWSGRGACPGAMRGWHHGRGMGPGMMHGWQGRGMGPGMMRGWQGRGQCWGMGPGMMANRWGGPGYAAPGWQPQAEALDLAAVRELAESYAAGNPNLMVGEISEQDDIFLATIVTKDGSLVEKLLVDKETGWIKKGY